jgi:hypothetical protein
MIPRADVGMLIAIYSREARAPMIRASGEIERMNLRHRAALALVGWHLLEPPFKPSASFASDGKYDPVTDAPLSK